MNRALTFLIMNSLKAMIKRSLCESEAAPAALKIFKRM